MPVLQSNSYNNRKPDYPDCRERKMALKQTSVSTSQPLAYLKETIRKAPNSEIKPVSPALTKIKTDLLLAQQMCAQARKLIEDIPEIGSGSPAGE
jgi:hypothetical protein